jgi:hypothetical protein
MTSRFSEFLSAEKIDPRRLVAASHKLERLRPEDRQIRLQRRLKKGTDAAAAAPAAEGAEKKESVKRRSGRPVTQRLLQQALAGAAISGPQKTRLLRALNSVLTQKKKGEVDLRKVF